MADSPGSPLSSIASDELTEDTKLDKDGHSPSVSSMPPSKRRRTGVASWDHHTPISSVQGDILPTSPSSPISSDTDGEIPNSPSLLALIGGGQDDDYSGQGGDQVSICRWDGCEAGDLGNMDNLVNHIHDDHIGTRQKKYSCEWIDCSRKGQTHASGYALRAHMRSHTREKPFYCALPECDRSFTRSDALAKHMRTVHETEALRPSDPVPKSQLLNNQQNTATPINKVQRIKLKLNFGPREDTPSSTNGEGGTTGNVDGQEAELVPVPEFTPDLGFDAHELALPPSQLYRLLRRQVHWAEIETSKLKQQWQELEPKRKEAFFEKEAALTEVIDAEGRLSKIVYDAQREADKESGNAQNGAEEVVA
ncbi:C2H2 finger domain protein (Gli3), putative [Talaromyces stipitatus ATCC 10500]|uniref:C2H2 finger domain protein (Gli3), putative n=1 Tax=Talaromyces stipitatus (strain ATCC 10500 / CBS 375.48 / QM 6759 / NRRL 1006) TaxID=441959 RepID=B8LW46_TALSN|nr:C2H2 finger domain protein (Gli3), putative [Talaromyces stipitatus ATCC 10500]EED24074.1 C2H2 finger domain protein (Gli3), putative [Talaromyces stipitatus ATCC 10500]